nr:zinc finger, CCHC-type [Tanacetum cinerariifolium]
EVMLKVNLTCGKFSNCGKRIILENEFEVTKWVNFRRWQKKMHFLLSSMSVVYVLTTPIPEDSSDDATVKQIKKKAKWDNDDYVYRGLILNGKPLSRALFWMPTHPSSKTKPK